MKQKDVLSDRKQTCKNVLEKLILVRTILHFPVSEQILAKGLVAVTFESPGNIQVSLIQTVQGREGRGHTVLEVKACVLRMMAHVGNRVGRPGP